MAIQNDYLVQNNLHWRPISSLLNRAVFYVATSLERSSDEEKWHGFIVRAVAKGTLGIGVLAVVPIALIESVATFILGSLGLIFNAFCYDHQSEFLQKYSLRSMAYSLHSLAESIQSLVFFVRLGTFEYHTANLLLEHMIHLASATAMHTLFGAWVDRKAGREMPEDHYEKIQTNLFQDNFQRLGSDLLWGLQKDFAEAIHNLTQEPTLEGFLNDHPEHREFFQEFNFQSLSDPEYRQQTLTHVNDAFHQITELPEDQLQPILERAHQAGGWLHYLAVPEA